LLTFLILGRNIFDTVQIWKINHCIVSCDISNFCAPWLKALQRPESQHAMERSRSNRAWEQQRLPTFIDKNTYELSNSQEIRFESSFPPSPHVLVQSTLKRLLLHCACHVHSCSLVFHSSSIRDPCSLVFICVDLCSLV
jgi:hypothetical protein